MTCKHSVEDKCRITGERCTRLADENHCAEQSGGIIWYLKAIGTYERVLNDPKYTNGVQAESYQIPPDREKLSPCPFCGSPAELYGECDMVWARCSNEDCRAERICKFNEPEEAIEDWNDRA